MPVLGEEYYLGRSGSGAQRKLKFIVTGTDSDIAAKQWVEANAPSSHDGLAFTSVSGITQQSNTRWLVDANYGATSGTAAVVPEPESGTATYTFSAQVEPTVEYYSIEQVAKYPDNAPDNPNGLIGLQLAEGEGRFAGIEVPAGPITDEVTYEYPSAVIPASYRDTVRPLIGTVNDMTYLSAPPGSLRLISVRSSVTSDNKQSINFGFAYRENRTNVLIGQHTIPTLDGWDFIWSIDRTLCGTFTPTGGDAVEIITREPYIVYVERLCKRANFHSLDLPQV